jgi:hypothetical protein
MALGKGLILLLIFYETKKSALTQSGWSQVSWLFPWLDIGHGSNKFVRSAQM